MSTDIIKNAHAKKALSDYFKVADDLEFGIPWSFHYLRKKLKKSSVICFEAIIEIDRDSSINQRTLEYYAEAFKHAQKCKSILSVFYALSVGDPVKVTAAEEAISNLIQHLSKIDLANSSVA